MDQTPYEKKDAAPKLAVVPDEAPEAEPVEESVEAPAEEAVEAPTEDAVAEVLNDCGHPGPSFYAASGTGTVAHCGKCAGMTGY